MGLKIIHGMSEIAGQGIYAVQGLRQNGVHADMAVWKRNPSGYPVDIDLKIDLSNKIKYPVYVLKMGAFAHKALKKYDVVHSHFGYSLMPYNVDVPRLKASGRKLFTEFHGTELRFIFNDIEYEYYKGNEPSEHRRQKQGRRLMKLLKHSDGIILHDEELIPHLPEVDCPVYILPLRLDVGKFTPEYPDEQKERPVIVHAPSSRSTKGTEGILEALKKVSKEYELILVEGKTQKEAFEIYRKADIIIDQISVGAYGVFALEAMAMGKPVITYISGSMRQTFPAELPIVSADFDSLPTVIEGLIDDGERRRELGHAGRKYVERYHDNVKVTKYLAQIYTGEITDNNVFHLL